MPCSPTTADAEMASVRATRKTSRRSEVNCVSFKEREFEVCKAKYIDAFESHFRRCRLMWGRRARCPSRRCLEFSIEARKPIRDTGLYSEGLWAGALGVGPGSPGDREQTDRQHEQADSHY